MSKLENERYIPFSCLTNTGGHLEKDRAFDLNKYFGLNNLD